MSIQSIIRKKSGDFKKVRLTPLKAIMYSCLECADWRLSEVKSCKVIMVLQQNLWVKKGQFKPES